MKVLRYLTSLLIFTSIIFTSCENNDPIEENQTSDEIFFANQFAYHALDIYYRWNNEIRADMERLDPRTNQDPISTVEDIRYKENGIPIDRWTFLTNDYNSMVESTERVATTFGFHPTFYRMSKNDTQVIAVINYVSKDSPAEKAGLNRGDIIYAVDNKTLTAKNFVTAFNTSFATFTMAEIKDNKVVPTKHQIKMTAVKMYEDPIIAYDVFNINEKRIAYLAYTGFDLISIPKLIDICKYFKTEKASELILDLRYNGGGYVKTEEVLASMLAPKHVVDAKKLYEIEEYNNNLTALFRKEGIDTKSYFSSSFNIDKKDYNTADANIGLKKIYALVSSSTASASESILIGLMPYIDITIIGEQTHGKYCTGVTLNGNDIFKKMPPAIKNWGIYVMIGVYKNSLGKNPCIPSGIQPNYSIQDDPFNPLPLGNMEEPLTLTAIKLSAGESIPNTRNAETVSPKVKLNIPTNGLRIADHEVIGNLAR